MNLSLIMRKSFIVRSLCLLGMFLFVVSSCKQEAIHEDNHGDLYALEIDSSLAVLLKPTNQEVVSTLPTVKPERGAQLFSVELPGRINYDARNQSSIASRVSGRIERIYVKYNYQPIQKGALIMEIYSPDLAAAQRELLMVATTDPGGELLQKAKQRLSLLGMSAAQIDKLIRTKEVNYRIPVYSNASGYLIEKLATNVQNPSMNETELLMSNSPVLLREGQYVNAGQSLFTVYKSGELLAEFSIPPSLANAVKVGTSLLIQSEDTDKVFKGKIGLIEPVQRNGEYFSSARAYLSNTDFRPGQLVKANVPVFLKEGWWVPKNAVWQSGIESIVFKKENGVFVPKNVKIGVMLDGKIQLLVDISDWEVASNAYYLVDSESFIRPQNTKEQD